ncbi:branched-chain amino acid aminotransferase [Apiospora kogelbergensis]|uniref:branched-chain amino acid aminotransferase n=1 Tax=Apiospora kogelbergensis TaxID=1337665 RepID=UPI003131AECD
MGSMPERQGHLAVRSPRQDVDWQSVGFTPYEVNGHIECSFTTETGKWSEPRFVASPYMSVHGLAPGLNYGQQAFEGLRVFRDPEERVKLFRVESHAARFARSTEAVAAAFARAVRLAVLSNSDLVPPFASGCSMYVRPVAFASSASMNLQPADAYVFAVFVTPVAVLYGDPRGLRALVVESFDRTAPRGTGAFKVGGNYGPTVPVMRDARARGYGLVLHLDSATRSYVHEFSASGFVAVKEGDAHILPSITVDSVSKIAEGLGWTVERREIPFRELSEFSEVYTVGTASSLVPVAAVVRESTGERFEYKVDVSSPDAANAILKDRLEGIKRGLRKDSWGWVQSLEECEECKKGIPLEGFGAAH